MADLAFYTGEYLGNAIPEKTFEEVMMRARAALGRLRRIYTVAECTAVEENMALCAMAEKIYAYGKREVGIAAASVGNVSVHYAQKDADRALGRELYRAASIYLDIRRGVEG